MPRLRGGVPSAPVSPLALVYPSYCGCPDLELAYGCSRSQAAAFPRTSSMELRVSHFCISR